MTAFANDIDNLMATCHHKEVSIWGARNEGARNEGARNEGARNEGAHG